MTLKYLLDENADIVYQTQLIQRNSSLIILVIGDTGVPSKSTLNPKKLCWCEEHNFVLVTNNRSSMPIYLAAHIAQYRHTAVLNDS